MVKATMLFRPSKSSLSKWNLDKLVGHELYSVIVKRTTFYRYETKQRKRDQGALTD